MKKFIFTNQTTVIALVALAIMSLSSILSYLYFAEKQRAANETSPNTEVLAVQKREILSEPPEDLTTLNILLLGYGGAGHQGGYLTDVIQIVHFNFETKLIKLISIPRDLWVSLPNGKQAKVNQAFTLGSNPNEYVASGGEVSQQMISLITGLPIDYFVAASFVDFQRAIGEDLGGIEVNVPETLKDPWYPIQGEELNTCGMTPEKVAELTATYSGFELESQFECRYEHLYFEQGINHMEGGDALKYVRSRHGSTAGDFSRSFRQQAVLKGIRDKLLSLEAFDQAPQFFETISENITTDLNLEVVKYLIPAIKDATQYEVKSVILSTDNVLTTARSSTGQSILVPQAGADQWQAVQDFIEQ
jgi:polyisoprenyl-teichoic acid--peptidoglycan teichoic acid transferase